MFQGILIFSDWMFKKKIIVFPHLFLLLGEKILKNWCLEFWVGNVGKNKNS